MEDQSRPPRINAPMSAYASASEDSYLKMPGPWDDAATRGRSGVFSRTSEFSARDLAVPRTPSPGPMYYEFMGEPAKLNSMNSANSFEGAVVSPGIASPYSFRARFDDCNQHSPSRRNDYDGGPAIVYWTPPPLFSPEIARRRTTDDEIRSRRDDRFLRTPLVRDPREEDVRGMHRNSLIPRVRSAQASYEATRVSCASSSGRAGSVSPSPPGGRSLKSRRSFMAMEKWWKQERESMGDRGGKRKGKESKNEMEPMAFSSFLEEFRIKGTVDTKKMCASGAANVIEFARDQFGSRFLQQRIEQGSTEERAAIFKCVRADAVSLSLDVFGNYVIQKIFDLGSPHDSRILASQFLGSVLHLALHMYGCRVIQKALEWCALDLQQKIVVELQGHVVECVEHQNGNHVIQKCIERIPQVHVASIVREIASSDVIALSRHCYGCRVLQRVIEHCNESDMAPIYEKVVPQWRLLASDPYGNYVIQHIMEHGRPVDKQRIICEMRPQMRRLACDKFASNVLERSLSSLPAKERQLLTSAILMDEGNSLIELSRDRFGNYIVQRMLAICTGIELDALTTILDSRKGDLKGVVYGKHIVSALDRARLRNEH